MFKLKIFYHFGNDEASSFKIECIQILSEVKNYQEIGFDKIKISFRLKSPHHVEKFLDILSCTNFDFLRHCNVNDGTEQFNNLVNSIYCRCFPLKTKYVSIKLDWTFNKLSFIQILFLIIEHSRLRLFKSLKVNLVLFDQIEAWLLKSHFKFGFP